MKIYGTIEIDEECEKDSSSSSEEESDVEHVVI